MLLLLLTLPGTVQAQFLFETNGHALTITGYTGTGGEVDIPSEAYGLPVVSIGAAAFLVNCPLCSLVTSVTIPNSVTNIGGGAFLGCPGLTNITLGNGLICIGMEALRGLPLTSITFPDSLLTIQSSAFFGDPLTSVTIPDSVTDLGIMAFQCCALATNVTIGNGLTDIGLFTFAACSSLTSVTIGTNVARLEQDAFGGCSNLTAVYFKGNAPSVDPLTFYGDTHATVYYLPGTTGWGPTFGGLPAVMWNPPALQSAPQTQTAEAGSAVCLQVKASGASPLASLWYFNGTNFLICSTNCQLDLTNAHFAQSGTYTVVVTNFCGAVTSSPAMLNVIAPVQRRPVPGINVAGQAGSLLNLDYADSLGPAPNWTTLGSVSLSSTSQYYFDLTMPLPAQRFFRAWQTGTPGVTPSLEGHSVPAITLTGSIGDWVLVEYINQYGPIDAWVTLDTVTLTNTSQLYFDVSAIGQPPRLWRIVPVP